MAFFVTIIFDEFFSPVEGSSFIYVLVLSFFTFVHMLLAYLSCRFPETCAIVLVPKPQVVLVVSGQTDRHRHSVLVISDFKKESGAISSKRFYY